jgi:hypothetical protein
VRKKIYVPGIVGACWEWWSTVDSRGGFQMCADELVVGILRGAVDVVEGLEIFLEMPRIAIVLHSWVLWYFNLGGNF